MVNVAGADCPADGAGLPTVTAAVPRAATSGPRTSARSSIALMNVVVRG